MGQPGDRVHGYPGKTEFADVFLVSNAAALMQAGYGLQFTTISEARKKRPYG